MREVVTTFWPGGQWELFIGGRSELKVRIRDCKRAGIRVRALETREVCAAVDSCWGYGVAQVLHFDDMAGRASGLHQAKKNEGEVSCTVGGFREYLEVDNVTGEVVSNTRCYIQLFPYEKCTWVGSGLEERVMVQSSVVRLSRRSDTVVVVNGKTSYR